MLCISSNLIVPFWDKNVIIHDTEERPLSLSLSLSYSPFIFPLVYPTST
jgi:hypothetical protein